jgi:hypothetical protein
MEVPGRTYSRLDADQRGNCPVSFGVTAQGTRRYIGVSRCRVRCEIGLAERGPCLSIAGMLSVVDSVCGRLHMRSVQKPTRLPQTSDRALCGWSFNMRAHIVAFVCALRNFNAARVIVTVKLAKPRVNMFQN